MNYFDEEPYEMTPEKWEQLREATRSAAFQRIRESLNIVHVALEDTFGKIIPRLVGDLGAFWEALEPAHRDMAHAYYRRKKSTMFLARRMAYQVPREWLPPMDRLYRELRCIDDNQ